MEAFSLAVVSSLGSDLDLTEYQQKRKMFSKGFPHYCEICQFRYRLGC